MNKMTTAMLGEVDKSLMELFGGLSWQYLLDGKTLGIACAESAQMVNSYISGRRKLHPNNPVVRQMSCFSQTHLEKYLEHIKTDKEKDLKLEFSPSDLVIRRQMCNKWVNDGLRGLNSRISQFNEEMILPYQVAMQRQNQRAA